MTFEQWWTKSKKELKWWEIGLRIWMMISKKQAHAIWICAQKNKKHN